MILSVDTEFFFHFQMSQEKFWMLLNLIQDHTVFKRKPDGKQRPGPASHQLLVLLKYYGSHGNSASDKSLSRFFGVGGGTVENYRNNALEALLSLEPHAYFWPCKDERKSIASRIKSNWKFPNCVGLIDGTLLPLAIRPVLHGENYLSRKGFYVAICSSFWSSFWSHWNQISRE